VLYEISEMPITLKSNDDRSFVVSKEVACQSTLIKNMLEDVGEDDNEPIPLHNVTGPILEKGMHVD
jgi:S-phase kinase-associated protein 1